MKLIEKENKVKKRFFSKIFAKKLKEKCSIPNPNLRSNVEKIENWK